MLTAVRFVVVPSREMRALRLSLRWSTFFQRMGIFLSAYSLWKPGRAYPITY
jgi:hypothetical protein